MIPATGLFYFARGIGSQASPGRRGCGRRVVSGGNDTCDGGGFLVKICTLYETFPLLSN